MSKIIQRFTNIYHLRMYILSNTIMNNYLIRQPKFKGALRQPIQEYDFTGCEIVNIYKSIVIAALFL